MTDPCNCDDTIALRAELAIVTAERDYLAGMADPSDLRTMRQELARDSSLHVRGCDCDACLPGYPMPMSAKPEPVVELTPQELLDAKKLARRAYNAKRYQLKKLAGAAG